MTSSQTAVFVCSHHDGHLNPILSLVPLFQASGYDVHFFSAAYRQKKIESTGATFHVDGPAYVEGGVFFEQILPITVAYLDNSKHTSLMDRIKALNPTVIISDVSALWGVLCAKLLKIPLITSCSCSLMDSLDPFTYLRDLDFLQKSVSWLNEKYQISYDPKESYLNESDFLINWSIRDFQTAMKRDAPNVKYFGAALPRDFEAKESGKKVIYISLGTVVGQEKWTLAGSEGDMVADFYCNVFKFLGDNPNYSCVVSIGQCRSVGDMGTIPSNFYVRQRVPQVLLLTRADAFVTHCGNNGVHEALFCGTPMLCVPVFGDQHPNADTIARLKLGVQIPSPFAPAPSPNLDHVTSNGLCDKLKELLANGEIKKECKEFMNAMRKQHEYFHSQAFTDMQNYIDKPTINVRRSNLVNY